MRQRRPRQRRHAREGRATFHRRVHDVRRGTERGWQGAGGLALHRRRQRRQSTREPIACSADDEGHHVAVLPEQTEVERELGGLLGGAAQRHHRGRQGIRVPMQVHGGDRLVAQRRCQGGPGGVQTVGQSRGLDGAAAEHHGVERLIVDGPRGVRLSHDRLHAAAQPQAGALPSQPLARRQRKQARQAGRGQQQIRAARATEQGVGEHTQEHRGAGLRRWRVQRSDAQRVDQVGAHPIGQAGAKLRHRVDTRIAHAVAQPAERLTQQRPALAPTPAAHASDRPGKSEVHVAARQTQAAAVGVEQFERPPMQHLRRVHADQPHQTQGFGVGADQDVLAVVERQ